LCAISQLAYPDRVEGLVLLNCTAGQAGWVEWSYQKVTESLTCVQVCMLD